MIDLNEVDVLPDFKIGDQFTMNDTLYTVERVIVPTSWPNSKYHVVSSDLQGVRIYHAAGDLTGDWEGCAHVDLTIEQALAGELLRLEHAINQSEQRA